MVMEGHRSALSRQVALDRNLHWLSDREHSMDAGKGGAGVADSMWTFSLD